MKLLYLCDVCFCIFCYIVDTMARQFLFYGSLLRGKAVVLVKSKKKNIIFAVVPEKILKEYIFQDLILNRKFTL